jgi:hypothetical protein
MGSSFMNQVIEAGSVKDALIFILFSSVKTVLDANIEASKSNSSFALDSVNVGFEVGSNDGVTVGVKEGLEEGEKLGVNRNVKEGLAEGFTDASKVVETSGSGAMSEVQI